ncbi:hypothetical protein V2J09_015339 [Rumex salicifolius]
MNMATLVFAMSTIILGILLLTPSIIAQGSGQEDLQASLSLPRKLKVGDKNKEEERMLSEFMGMDYYQAKRRRPVHNNYPRPAAP